MNGSFPNHILFNAAFIGFTRNKTAAAVIIINTVARRELGVLITILHFGVRQIILLAVLSILIAAAASLIPVYRIASKRPIDAIRDK